MESKIVIWQQNYKAYVNVGFTFRSIRHFDVILDTCTGSSFFRKDVIANKIWKKVKPLTIINVQNANNSKFHTIITKTLAVEIGGHVEMVNCNVVDLFASNVLLGSK